MEGSGLQLIQDIIQRQLEQAETIQELRAELGRQKEHVEKQEKVIAELSSKVGVLELKLSLKEDADEEKSSKESIWKGTEALSLADAVKETAEKALLTNLGFVFDPTTKLYCNYNTGYYYDSAQGLFYNGHTGTYYTYDADNQKYVFHSQVQLQQATDNEKTKKGTDKMEKNSKSKAGQKSTGSEKIREKKGTRKCTMNSDILPTTSGSNTAEHEEGELSSSEFTTDEESCDNYSTDDDESSESGVEEFSPCIRAIVVESNCSTIRKGSLYLITINGGSIGREGTEHAICLPDSNIDKVHAKIVYQEANDEGTPQKKYYICDNGSANGTFLNGSRLSEPSQPSELHEIVHGSIVKVGSFSILMHIHPGNFTCGHCEPGLLLEPDAKNAVNGIYKSEKPKSRNALLKNIKKKYGVDKPENMNKQSDVEMYKDRAKERRKVKGSDNPFEKTHVASTDESIAGSNKGFKMMSKMGWKQGQTLGSSGDGGLLEPIKLEVRSNRVGLGMESQVSSGNSVPPEFVPANVGSNRSSRREKTLSITQKRFREAGIVEMEVDENLPT